jgi:hypothetical protein
VRSANAAAAPPVGVPGEPDRTATEDVEDRVGALRGRELGLPIGIAPEELKGAHVAFKALFGDRQLQDETGIQP